MDQQPPAPAQHRLSDSDIRANMTSGGNAAFHNFNNDFAHISDLNERRRLTLAQIDNAPFGWYHVRAIVVAGIGFFTDSYDIFAIGLVTGMIGIVYYGGTLPSSSDTAIKVAAAAGTVIGQLVFGALADIFGRKRMYGLELIIIIVGTLACALSARSPAVEVVGLIVFWRVIMGVGIGGDYPLSAIITSEFATTKWRGFMMNSVFAMQGFGQLAAGIVLLIVTSSFKGSLSSAGPKGANCSASYDCLLAADKMWRIVVGLGAVPGCIALYFRLTIPETPRYTFDVGRDISKAVADADAYRAGKWGDGYVDDLDQAEVRVLARNQLTVPKASFGDFFRYHSHWRNAKTLIGTAGSWFCLDVAFYGVGLNNPIILNDIGWSGGANQYEYWYRTAVGQIILVLAGAVPGYWVSALTIDTIGRKPIQIGGFLILFTLFCVIGFDFWNLSAASLMALYVLCNFFFNFGPNSTTFIVPGECFPTRYRSTAHGISAASGKVGAIIAQAVFGPLKTLGVSPVPSTDPRSTAPWLNRIMQIFALFMLAGALTSLLIPETRRRTLEEHLSICRHGVDGVTNEKLVEEGHADTK